MLLASAGHRCLKFITLFTGTHGQSSNTPHTSITSQLVQSSHFSYQYLPEHPITKVTCKKTKGLSSATAKYFK